MYVVAGVTGNTGSVVARELLARGQPVRVVVREESRGAAWKARGAEVAVASLDDAAALARALKGAKGAYLLCPPQPTATDYVGAGGRLTDVLAEAVKQSGLPHAVFLSSIGAHLPAGTGPIITVRHAEHKLAKVARAITFLRPAYFLENWGAVLGAVQKDGVLPSFIPPAHRMAMVSAADIGRVAASNLLTPVASGSRVVELAGPAEVSPEDVARTLGTLLGKPVQVAALPLDAVVPTFTSFGMSADVARLYRELYEGILANRIAYEARTPLVRGEIALAQGLGALLQRPA